MFQLAQMPDLALAQPAAVKTRQVSTFDYDKRTKTILIAPGERKTTVQAEGAGAITALWMTFPGWFWQHWNTEAPISQTILKTLILRIYWDGEEKPAIEAPAGDFFGVGLCEVANYTSRFIGMSSGGFFCRFPMPYRKGFRIEIENMDETITTDIFMNAMVQECDALPEGMRYLHTDFRTAKCEGTEDFEVANWSGAGHYAGIALSMQSPVLNYLSFLEAPEYIYVDEDWERPRIVGTGLEDYFMGGWYFREGTFQGEHHGVPVKDTLRAKIAMYRWHEADAIYFNDRFRMEFVNPFDAERLKPFMFSSVAFGYRDRAAGDGRALPGREQLLIFDRIRDCDHQSIP